MGLNREQTFTRMCVRTSAAEPGGVKKWKGEYKALFVARLVTCGHNLATSIHQAVWREYVLEKQELTTPWKKIEGV